uniref:Uncharacterized protein n=1 Tax=Glossina austeni TaxID=7395 RepID=A0A1A9VTT9_GLOAU
MNVPSVGKSWPGNTETFSKYHLNDLQDNVRFKAKRSSMLEIEMTGAKKAKENEYKNLFELCAVAAEFNCCAATIAGCILAWYCCIAVANSCNLRDFPTERQQKIKKYLGHK